MPIARRTPECRLCWLVVLTCALAACGTRTEPAFAFEALADAPAPDTSPAFDTGVDTSIDASIDAAAEAAPDAAPACPARRPRANEGCDLPLEGLECPYGSECRTSCVCERGSWICLRDSCFDRCPTLVPYDLSCDPAQIDRECDYLKGCPSYCRCEPADAGARWRCAGPPC